MSEELQRRRAIQDAVRLLSDFYHCDHNGQDCCLSDLRRMCAEWEETPEDKAAREQAEADRQREIEEQRLSLGDD